MAEHDFRNPFTGLIQREYSPTNIKKILDVFPSSLQVQQLTSTQLLEQLRDTIVTQGFTIEQLRALLADRERTSDDINNISSALRDLENRLQLGETIEGLIEDSEKQSRINALLTQGYERFEGTDFFVKVNDVQPTFRGYDDSRQEFRIIHDNIGDTGVTQDELLSPTTISFKNLSSTDTYWFKKEENWKTNSDGLNLPINPTNAFRFQDFPELHITAGKIEPNDTFELSVVLGYNTFDDYQDAGLDLGGFDGFDFEEVTEYFGVMLFRVTTNSSDGIDNQTGVEIGEMRILHDRN